MQEEGKHTYSKEELLKLIKEGKSAPEDMDEFDREAMEGLKLLTNQDVLDKVNKTVDEIVEEEEKNKRAIYYFSAAASLLLLIGLVFFFKNSFVNKNEKPLALAEKPKEENIVSPANPSQAETSTTYEDKEPEQKSGTETKSKTALAKDAGPIASQGAAAPVLMDKITTENKAADNYNEDDAKQADEKETLNKNTAHSNDVSTLSAAQTKQAEQTVATNQTETNSDNVAGGTTYKEEGEQKTSVQETKPSQAVAYSQGVLPSANQPTEKDVEKSKAKKADLLYESSNTKTAIAQNYKEPAFIGGDTAFINYTKQNLKISSPNNSGIVTVSFLITKNGKAENIKVTKPISNCTVCSDDVINLIKSVKKWQPASMNGKAIDATKKVSIQYN